MKKFIFFSAAFLLTPYLYSQSIKGIVRDAATNSPLHGASITTTNGFGTVSLEDGTYNLKLRPNETYTIKVEFIGYDSQEQEVKLGSSDKVIDFYLTEKTEELSQVNITALRANEETPIAYQNVSKEAIEERNLGQDIPIILDQTVSAVSTSDAGAGVGYTGLRIRGSDQSRINVTINGIPLNDAESQGVFWVNTPDFASSLQSAQIQRGAGTSTNGSGAFGASINLQTADLQEKPFAQAHLGYGSFNTQRYTLQFGSGLINKRWVFQGRLSKIQSDGFLDRATSDLNSYFFTGGYVSDKTEIKAVVFGGNEVTYQAWNGVDSATFASDPTTNTTGAIYDTNFNVIGYYDNQVDDYSQTHYQLHINHTFRKDLKANLSFHYTKGLGFFEEYRSNDLLANYGITGTPETNSDLVRRLWLDNDFYGFIYNVNYAKGPLEFVLGGGANEYDGDHFGEVIWARYAGNTEPSDRFYFNRGNKRDVNTYLKTNMNIGNKMNLFVDLQYRYVNISGAGSDENMTTILYDDDFNFFNPKVGLSARLNKKTLVYASYAIAQREPSRQDYVGAAQNPVAERLGDLEVGSRLFLDKVQINANVYYMHYSNQLVLTGEINNVGTFLRSNVGESYRLGIELDAMVEVTKKLRWLPNLSISDNRILDYRYTLTDANGSTNIIDAGNSTIAFSPNLIAGSTLAWEPFKGFEIALVNKYVGVQQLDNTGREGVALAAYFLTDVRINYQIPQKLVKGVLLELGVFNITDEEYASNGYAGDGFKGYYPQAGINFLTGLKIDF